MCAVHNRPVTGRSLDSPHYRRNRHRPNHHLVTPYNNEQKMILPEFKHPRRRLSSLADLPLPLYPSLDSVWIHLPRDFVTIEASERWDRKTYARSGNVTLEYPKDDLPLGVNRIAVASDDVVVAISSKILHSRYRELLNWRSIDAALENLNETPGVTFDARGILTYGTISRLDVTRDVVVSKYPPDYLKAAVLASRKPGYACEKYYSPTEQELQTVVFTRRQSKRTDRLSMYWKYPELIRAGNRELRKYVNAIDMWPVLRLERSIRDFKTIRNAFNVESPQLMFDVLTGRCNPVAWLFFEISPTSPEIAHDSSARKLMDIEKHEGRKAILSSLDWDENRVKEFVYTRGPSTNKSRSLRPYLHLIAERKADERREENLDEELAELRQKVAAPFHIAEGLMAQGGSS